MSWPWSARHAAAAAVNLSDEGEDDARSAEDATIETPATHVPHLTRCAAAPPSATPGMLQRLRGALSLGRVAPAATFPEEQALVKRTSTTRATSTSATARRT